MVKYHHSFIRKRIERNIGINVTITSDWILNGFIKKKKGAENRESCIDIELL